MIASQKKYIEGIGRRKTASARVRLYELKPMDRQGDFLVNNKNLFLVNNKNLNEYFPTKELKTIASESLLRKFAVSVKVGGGGINAQAEAIRLGIARALVSFDAELKPILRAHGFLSRDSRKTERKKPGLKKARRAPQWSKR